MAESEVPKFDFDGVDDVFKTKKVTGWLGNSSFECCPWSKFSRPHALNLMRWKMVTKDNTALPKQEKDLDKVLPILRLDRNKINNPPADDVQVTWIGHATMLVQFEGITILTDPVFGDYCGPSQIPDMFNYKRYREASCGVRDIDKNLIDAVIISHDHYDHLETKAVQDINSWCTNVKWFVPSGLKSWMKNKGVNPSNVVELEWWQYDSLKVKGKEFKFISTPTQHWCQRGPHDFNKALWCGWVVKGPEKSFYFGGDTGYYEKLFKTIGDKYGPFDLAGIPVGAYEPRYITEFQHVDPEEAVKIHRDIKSKQSIGIHWGTLSLTNEFFVEPAQRVKQHMTQYGFDTTKFFCINHGETWSTRDNYKERDFMRYTQTPGQDGAQQEDAASGNSAESKVV